MEHPSESRPEPAPDWDPRFPWRAALGAWAAFILVESSVVRLHIGVPFADALLTGLVKYGVFAAGGVAVWHVMRRLAQRRRHPALLAAVHLALPLLVIGSAEGVNVLRMRNAIGSEFWELAFADTWAFQLLSDVVLYAALLGATLAVQRGRRTRAQERREAHLRVLAREAELAALRAQLQPHFLFNTLNSCVALMDSDPPQARRMLVRLAELLHAVFDEMEESVVPLARELGLLEAYLHIEGLRFGDRLTTRIDVPAAARDTPVPPFLLQPLVENALKHGVAPYAIPGEVTVTGRVVEARLRLEVADSGPGMDPADAALAEGRGLVLTRRRLQEIYGGAAALSLGRVDGRFVARIDLPLVPPA